MNKKSIFVVWALSLFLGNALSAGGRHRDVLPDMADVKVALKSSVYRKLAAQALVLGIRPPLVASKEDFRVRKAVGGIVAKKKVEGMTDLHHAALAGRFDDVKTLIAKSKDDINAQDSEGDTPLMLAVKLAAKNTVMQTKSVDIMELLLANGADATIKNNEGDTPLDLAIAKASSLYSADNAKKMVAIFRGEYVKPPVLVPPKREKSVDSSSVIKKVAEKEQCPYSFASLTDMLETYILSRLSKPADKENFKEFIKKFKNSGYDVSTKDADNRTILHWAAAFGPSFTRYHDGWVSTSFDCGGKYVNALLDKGVDINAQDKDGRTALHLAVYHRRDDLLKVLLHRNSTGINIKDNNQRTALYYLIRPNKILGDGGDFMVLGDRIDFLIEKGADVNALDSFGYTILDNAYLLDRRSAAAILKKHGAVGSYFVRAREAVIRGGMKVAEPFLEVGAGIIFLARFLTGNLTITIDKERGRIRISEGFDF